MIRVKMPYVSALCVDELFCVMKLTWFQILGNNLHCSGIGTYDQNENVICISVLCIDELFGVMKLSWVQILDYSLHCFGFGMCMSKLSFVLTNCAYGYQQTYKNTLLEC